MDVSYAFRASATTRRYPMPTFPQTTAMKGRKEKNELRQIEKETVEERKKEMEEEKKGKILFQHLSRA